MPNRRAMDVEVAQLQLQMAQTSLGDHNNNSNNSDNKTDRAYQFQVAKACGMALEKRILTFHEQPPAHDRDDLKSRYNRPLRPLAANTAVAKRKIPTVPDRYFYIIFL